MRGNCAMTKPNRRVTTCEAMMDDLEMDAVTFLVLMRLAAFADYKTGENARPAAQTLADLLKLSVTTIRTALRKGIALGYLTKEERRHDDKTSEPSVYKCLWIAPLMQQQSKKPNDKYLSPSRQGEVSPSRHQPSTSLPATKTTPPPRRRKRAAWEQAIADAKQHRETKQL